MSTFNLVRDTFGSYSGYSFECFGIKNIDAFCLRYREAMPWGKYNISVNKIDNFIMSSSPYRKIKIKLSSVELTHITPARESHGWDWEK